MTTGLKRPFSNDDDPPSSWNTHTHTHTHTNTIFFNNDPFVQSVSGREWSPTHTHTQMKLSKEKEFVTLEKKKKKNNGSTKLLDCLPTSPAEF